MQLNQSINIYKMKTPLFKSKKNTTNVREVSAICKVRTQTVERQVIKTVTVTDASRSNVKSEIMKLIDGVLLDFSIAQISAVYG